ncbi:hypothetical protein Tco_1393230 [Tanacetum coccineum]
MAEQDTTPPTITTMKIPIIGKGEYDIWSMRMRQYICHIDHNLWDAIVNGDLEEEPAPTRETSAPPAPKIAKQLVAKRNQERVKSILLLAIPDEYLLKFHNVTDAKSLWEAINSRFGGNDESKKMQKNVLKHQFENFSTALNESLDKAYDRVYKDEMKRSSSSISTSQNLAFLSSENTSSTNEVSTASGDFRIDEDDLEELDLRWQVAMLTIRCYNYHRKGHFARECKSGRNQGKRSYGDNGRSNAPTNESSSQALVAQDCLGGYDWSNDFEVELVNYALMAISSSSSSSSSDNEVQKCSKQCLESFKTLQKNYDSEREKHSKARLEIQGYELALELLESRILVHEKNELAWGEKYKFQNYKLKYREIKINNLNLELEKVVKERDELKLKIEKWEESSKNLDELLNSKMSARDKTGLGYGTHLNEMINNSKTDSEISLSVFDVRSSDEENTPANDSFFKVDGFYVVPPPIIGNFLTPRADISFEGLDEYAIRKKIIESKTTNLHTKTSETGNPEILLQDHVVVDSGFLSHMTGNKAYLSDYEDYNRGFVAFGSDPKGEYRMLILSPSFKLLDESQVVLRAPRKDDVYNLDLKNIVPSGGLGNQLNHNVKIIRCDNGTKLMLATAKVKTVNGERQIQALVDKKRVIITETSIISDLHLEDADGTDCLPTATIFEELARMGAKLTSWNEFSNTMASAIICLAINQKFNLSKYIFNAMTPITTQPSSSRPQKETEVPQDETHHDDSVPIPSNDPLLSGEDRMKLTELMILYTNLQKQVLDLEKAKDAQAKEIDGLKKRDIDSLGAQEDTSKQGRSFEDIDKDAESAKVDEKEVSTGVEDSDAPTIPVTTAGEVVTTTKIDEITTTSAPTTSIDEITLAQTLIEIKAAKPKAVTTAATTTTTTRPKARGVVVQEPIPFEKKDQVGLFMKEMVGNLENSVPSDLIEEERLEGKRKKSQHSFD